MSIKKQVLTVVAIAIVPALLSGQGKGVDPKDLLKPLGDSWPTHSGDYTGRRYSALKQIDRTNVKNLTLGWVQTLVEGPGISPFGGGAEADAEAAGLRAARR